MRVEKEITALEQEIKAIKASFEQSASMMNVYTTEITFSTSANLIQWNGNGHYEVFKYPWLDSLDGGTSDLSGNHTGYGTEQFVVTFNCTGGNNTFADIEFTPLNHDELRVIWTKRLPYAGGARWVVLVWPNGSYDGQGNYTWKANQFKIAVQSAIAGTLEAKMIWQ